MDCINSIFGVLTVKFHQEQYFRTTYSTKNCSDFTEFKKVEVIDRFKLKFTLLQSGCRFVVLNTRKDFISILKTSLDENHRLIIHQFLDPTNGNWVFRYTTFW